jgi:hypothetical protein
MGVKDIIEELKGIVRELEHLCKLDSCDLDTATYLIRRSQYLRTILQERQHAK